MPRCCNLWLSVIPDVSLTPESIKTKAVVYFKLSFSWDDKPSLSSVNAVSFTERKKIPDGNGQNKFGIEFKTPISLWEKFVSFLLELYLKEDTWKKSNLKIKYMSSYSRKITE